MYIYTILHNKGVFQFWMCAQLFPQILMWMYSHLFIFEIFCHSEYMCTRIHIHTKTYIHKNIHIYIQTDVCIYIHVYIWMYTSAYIYHDAFSCFVSHACTRAHKGGEKREIHLVASPNKHLQYLWIFHEFFHKAHVYKVKKTNRVSYIYVLFLQKNPTLSVSLAERDM